MKQVIPPDSLFRMLAGLLAIELLVFIIFKSL